MKIKASDIILGITLTIIIIAMVWVGKGIKDNFKRERERSQKAQEEYVSEERVNLGGVMVTIYNYKGHEYIIADAGYGAGIIHSESCPCRNP